MTTFELLVLALLFFIAGKKENLPNSTLEAVVCVGFDLCSVVMFLAAAWKGLLG